MKTLTEVLRDADPVAYEPAPSDRDRLRTRQTVLAAPRGGSAWSRRAIVRVAFAAVMLGSILAGSRYWARGVPDLGAVAAVRFDVRLAEVQPALGLREVAIDGRTLYLHQESVVTNVDIADARLVQGDGESAFSVAVTFTPEGAAKMSRATRDHIGRPLAILIDGMVTMAPVLRSPISASALITGQFTRGEAERIVEGIRGR